MDLPKTIADLRLLVQQIDRAILSLERLAESHRKRKKKSAKGSPDDKGDGHDLNYKC